MSAIIKISCLKIKNIKMIKMKYKFTSLEGTHKGVPSLKTPASTVTPKTIGSRLLNIACKKLTLIKKQVHRWSHKY